MSKLTDAHAEANRDANSDNSKCTTAMSFTSKCIGRRSLMLDGEHVALIKYYLPKHAFLP